MNYTEGQIKRSDRILAEARDLIASGWCKGASARTINNREIGWGDPQACKFCVLGAFDRVQFGTGSYSRHQTEDMFLARIRLSRVLGNTDQFVIRIVEVNDAPKTKKEHIYTAFDLAILAGGSIL